MDAAIKAIVVPYLRKLRFKGSGLHFRRSRAGAIDMLTFQFRSGGGALVVELARVSSAGFDFHGKHIPAVKAKVSYARERYRLGSELRVNYGDHWFDYEGRCAEDVSRKICGELGRAEVWALVDEMAVLGE